MCPSLPTCLRPVRPGHDDACPGPLGTGALTDTVSASPSQALYMFYALAIVCDDFFVPSLEKICEVHGRDLGSPSRAWESAGGDHRHVACQAPGQEGLEWGALWQGRLSGQALRGATAKPGSEVPRLESAGGLLPQTWQEEMPAACSHHAGPLAPQQDH